MENRIGFTDANTRREFFLTVRQSSNSESWGELAKKLDLGRAFFQQYQYGQFLLPESLFQKMLNLLKKETRTEFSSKTFLKPGNWGAAKGGKETYKKHPEIFTDGRKIGTRNSILKRLTKEIDTSIVLSNNLCELIGAIIGDGNVDGHLQKRNNLSLYHISITGHSTLDKDYLSNYTPKLIKNIFGAETKIYIYYRNDSNAMIMNINSKMIFCLLTQRFGFIAGKKTYTVKIPAEIIDSKNTKIFATIRGIFDTDGCIFFDKRANYNSPYPRIVLQIKSKPLFLQLKSFLEKHFSLYTRESNSRNTCCLEIYGEKQFTKWMKLIGFSNKKHLDRIEKNYSNQASPGI